MNSESNFNFKFGKEERICLGKDIEKLFSKNSSFVAYPNRIVYVYEKFDSSSIEGDALHYPKILISVPKRIFKRANKRNKIKRLVREAYRLNKNKFDNNILKNGQLLIGIIYINKELSSYHEMEKSIIKLIQTINTKLSDKLSNYEKNCN